MADAPKAEKPPDAAGRLTRRAEGRLRTVVKTFRISAVWLPVHGATEGQAVAEQPAWARRAGARLSDEEVVYGLIIQRTRFQDRALAEANVLNPGVASVELGEVHPAGSVAAQIAFGVRVKGNAVVVVAGFAPAVMAAAAGALESAYGQPVAVTAVLEPAAAAPTAADATTGWDRLAPLLGAIVTGIGVIGFVTFIGGVTVYARLRAAGFPAAPALGIFPSQDLIVIGAQTLVPELLWALAAVVLLAVAYTLFTTGLRVSDEEEEVILARSGWWGAPRRLLLRARRRVRAEEAALLAGHTTRFAAIWMFCFVVLVLVGATSPFFDELDAKHTWLTLLLVLVAALLGATVGSVTRRLLFLATATFLLVGVFLSFTAYWREGNVNQVRGAAIIRENKKPVAGLFVAEGSGRVYIARVSLVDKGACEKAGGGVDGCEIIDHRSRLVGISKDEVSDIALGDPKPPWRALQQAHHL